MKALKSKLASELLADPAAREGLRAYLAIKQTSDTREAKSMSFIVKTKNGLMRIHPTIVPKATKAS